MVCRRDILTTSQGRVVTSLFAVVIVAAGGLLVPTAYAGSVHIYDTAVVTSDSVRLSDVASLSGFPVSQGRELADFVIVDAPEPGKTNFIILQTIRNALRSQGVNFAKLTIHGATRCQVSRMIVNAPAAANTMQPSLVMPLARQMKTNVRANESIELAVSESYLSPNPNGTLRQAVVEFFQKELQAYSGVVDVLFDRHSEQMLGLSGPGYQFRISRSSKTKIGLTSVQVDIVSDSKLIQTIPLAVNVTLTRSLLSAKRAINAKATIRHMDVEAVPIIVTKLDHDVLDDPSLAIGLRANRFIPTGTLVKPDMLESVPLVMRGQLVRLTSVSGDVSVVTAAKAGGNGRIGETITVHSVDNKRVEFPATVVGPGRVQIGGKLPKAKVVAAAVGGRP